MPSSLTPTDTAGVTLEPRVTPGVTPVVTSPPCVTPSPHTHVTPADIARTLSATRVTPSSPRSGTAEAVPRVRAVAATGQVTSSARTSGRDLGGPTPVPSQDPWMVLRVIADLLTPCRAPDVAGGWTLCAHAEPWPCPVTRAHRLAVSAHPATHHTQEQ
jgi:hypothetical protein